MFEPFPILKTNRLTLVAIGQQHLNDLFRLFGNSEVTRYYNIITLTQLGEAQKIVDHFQNKVRDGLGIRWGICIEGSEQVIGTIGFNNFSKNHRANIGYDLLPEYWGKGIMNEALKAVLEYGFTILEVNRVEAEVMVGNTASENLLSRAGFTNEGLLRQWMYWNGQYYDMSMFSLLKREFCR